MKNAFVLKLFTTNWNLSFTGEFTFHLVTNNACTKTSNGYDYVSGFQFLGSKTQYECAVECTNYSWCRGILSGQRYCRLLADAYSVQLPGWQFVGFGNWIEPNLWKNSQITGYQCLVKTGSGMNENKN